MKQILSRLWLGFWHLSKKVKIGVLLVLVLVVGGLFYWSSSRSKAPTYRTTTVSKTTLITTVSESGSVVGSEVTVTAPGDGVVTALYVKNGDTVTQGQNLFKLQSTATPQQKASAYASYLSAQNTLNAANTQKLTLQSQMFAAWNKFYLLATNGTYSNSDGSPNMTNRVLPEFTTADDDWLAAEAAYKNQDSVVAQAQSALTSAWYAYSATQDPTVTAPIAGTVANIAVTQGSQVSGSTSSTSTTGSTTTNTSTSGTTVLTIGNMDALQVKLQASEVDVAQLKVGQIATVTFNALPNKTFVGKVTSVDSFGAVSSGVVTYNVYITLVSPSTSILPGMSASAIIQTNKKDDVLAVPSTAITTTNGQSSVRVMTNGQVTSVPVETGLVSDTDTEITSGLTEGQTVVTSTVTTTTSTSSSGSSPFSALGNRGFGGGGGTVIRAGGAGRGG